MMSMFFEGSESMKASVWKLSLLIVAVAVVATGQTAQVNNSGMVAVNDGQSLTTDPVTVTRDGQRISIELLVAEQLRTDRETGRGSSVFAHVRLRMQ